MSKRKILITGKGSYVGTSFMKWLEQWPDQYEVVELSVRGTEWKDHDFSIYDVILHLAAIVHKNEKDQLRELYYSVNRDLPLSVAAKAKEEGVGQFIFMSSMSVYGVEGTIGKNTIINDIFPCHPTSYYGKSKLAAEEELLKMNSDNFKIAVVRAPMIYGPNCPGNYTRLRNLALKTPVFPFLLNKRSMIYIDNLSEFIKWLMCNENNGIFFPQNKELVSTYELVRSISLNNNKNIFFSHVLALPIKLLGNNLIITKKLFGNLQYDPNVSRYDEYDYCVTDFETSIQKC